MGQLEDAVEGKFQSVHLEHLLEEDWGEQLIPRPRAIARACSCDADAVCEHVVAVAYAVADEVERSARVLLRWRGVAAVDDEVVEGSRDPWRGKELGELEPAAQHAEACGSEAARPDRDAAWRRRSCESAPDRLRHSAPPTTTLNFF